MDQTLYQNYAVEDFLSDADFRRYARFRYTEDVNFWNAWISQNHNNLQAYNEAYAELRIIYSDTERITPDRFKEQLWMDINQSIIQSVRKRKRAQLRLVWTGAVAASLFIGMFITWYANDQITIQTGFGETKTITLADGTEIFLNANSSLSYARAYKWKKIRAVSLNGEAYFKVKHVNINPSAIHSGELFQARTNNLQVQVLGTEFNLKERHHTAHVGLIKGKVKVTSIKSGAEYIMAPGNVIRLNTQDGKLVLDAANPSVQSAWTEGKLIVNQTSVNEIITAFEDLYGYKVILDNPALGNKKIDGSISIRSEQSLLFTLSNILNVNIKKEGKVIHLESRR